jgi:hypothetical protein
VEPRLKGYPPFSHVSPDQKQEIFAPLRLRVDRTGGLHVLNDDYRDIENADDLRVTHFNPDGTGAGATPIPATPPGARGRRIDDFAVDPGMTCYFLETFTAGERNNSRVVKVNPKGDVIWEAVTELACSDRDFLRFRGRLEKLFLDAQGRLYHASAFRPNQITEIDPGSGDTARMIDLHKGTEEKLFVTGAGDILRTIFDEARGGYAMTARSAGSDKEQVTTGGPALHGLLPFCFGVDDQKVVYAYSPATRAITRVSPRGEILDREPMLELLVQAGGDWVITHTLEEGVSEVSGRGPDGSTWRCALAIPPEYKQKAELARSLILVDEARRSHLLVGEAPGSSGVLLVFSATGELKEAIDPAPALRPLMTSVAPFRFWQVDGAGNIYFPLTAPDGFKVVRASRVASKESA